MIEHEYIFCPYCKMPVDLREEEWFYSHVQGEERFEVECPWCGFLISTRNRLPKIYIMSKIKEGSYLNFLLRCFAICGGDRE